MTMDELKAMLKEGKITQEQFDAMAKVIVPDDSKNPDSAENDGKNEKQHDEIDIKRLIEQEVDRATNRLGNDNKKLRSQLETLKKERLTAEERKDLEIKEKEEEIAQRERALAEKENRLYAIRAIKEAGLDDGGETSLDLIDFVMAEDTEAIDAKIKAFDKLVKAFVKAEVDKTFKEHGRTPEKGIGGGAKTNPYAKETMNLTEQMRLEKENPELAKQLQAAAR